MIDEHWTWEFYGYHSDELKPKSKKPIVARCDNCCQYRVLSMQAYRDICVACSIVNKQMQKITIRGMVCDNCGKEIERKRLASNKHHFCNRGCRSEWQKTHTCKKNNSNWQGGISLGKYCPKFNDEIKQYIRDKYNNCDYISGLSASVCNPSRKLDVHHVDYNKQQGCEDHEWRLIPLSIANHLRTNANRTFWNRLFTYSLQHDENYYETLPIDIWRTL